jgi:hypothetical protein
MHSTIFSFSLALATTVATPTPIQSIPQFHNLAYHGDGVYIGDLASGQVEFTPMAEILANGASESTSMSMSTSGTVEVTGLEHAFCHDIKPSDNVGELDQANWAVAQQAGAGRDFDRNTWIWVRHVRLFTFLFFSFPPHFLPLPSVSCSLTYSQAFRGPEASFLCNNAPNHMTSDIVVAMHDSVSQTCGRAGYGADWRQLFGSVNDALVGRTRKGRSFCVAGFNGCGKGCGL